MLKKAMVESENHHYKTSVWKRASHNHAGLKKSQQRSFKFVAIFIIKCLTIFGPQSNVSAFQHHFFPSKKIHFKTNPPLLSQRKYWSECFSSRSRRCNALRVGGQEEQKKEDDRPGDQGQEISFDVKDAVRNASNNPVTQAWNDIWERPGATRAQRAKYREELQDDDFNTGFRGQSWGGRDETWESQRPPQQSPQWDNSYDDDFQYNPRTVGPFIKSLRNFYNSLFWYGSPMDPEAEEEFAGLKFPDLMALYVDRLKERGSRRSRQQQTYEEAERSSAGPRTKSSQSPKTKGTRNPDFPDWQFGWEDSGAQGEEPYSSRPPPPKAAESEFFVEQWPDQRPRQYNNEYPGESSKDQTPLALKAKQRQLRTAMTQLQSDLERVDDRLRVLDVSLEMWYRRINAMRKQRLSPDSREVRDAQNRVKELKALGVVLEREAKDLERQIDNCNSNIRRIDNQFER